MTADAKLSGRRAQAALIEIECVVLTRQIFGVEPSRECIDAYRRAHTVVFRADERDGSGHRRISEAARLGWDLEALEFALRVRDKTGPLTTKVNILFYLMEATPQGFALFVNRYSSIPQAWLTLTGQTVRSIYKLVKGLILAWRFGHLRVPATHD